MNRNSSRGLAAWSELAAAIEALRSSDSATAEVRSMAAATRDLLQLVATWPVPRKLRLDEELAGLLFGLCEQVERALCDEAYCPAQCRHRADAACRLIIERQAAADAWLKRTPATAAGCPEQPAPSPRPT